MFNTILASLLLSLSLPVQTPAPATSLDNPRAKYERVEQPYVVLQRGPVTAVVVDNRPVDDATLPGHRAGYSGLARLSRSGQSDNLFVPAYAGLNFEHIHDGTTKPRETLFEPRGAPMELRRIDEFTVELYQPPTPFWKLESATRYALLDDGTVEMTFECIPRAETFAHGYIGLFWASYINQPESLDIHFRGTSDDSSQVRWIRGVTPQHGVRATHVAANDDREFVHDADFPLTLVFNRSNDRYHEPWYFGIRREMAYAMVFAPENRIRFAQSPSGGGQGNPAWDFQFFIPEYQVGRRYGFRMRAIYVPYQSHEQMQATVAESLRALRR